MTKLKPQKGKKDRTAAKQMKTDKMSPGMPRNKTKAKTTKSGRTY
jgi:hypothetical protein